MRKSLRVFALWLMSVTFTTVLAILVWRAFHHAEQQIGVPILIPPPVVMQEEPLPATGWIENPQAVTEVAKGLEFQRFADTPAGSVKDLPKFAYLWKGYVKLFARPPPSRNQGSIGSCVSFGTTTAIERTIACEIAFKGAQEEYRDLVQENVYGGSRVQVGQGKIKGDGSVGAWAAKYVKEWGVLERKKYADIDLTTYSIPLCKAWGDKGVPTAFQELARAHPVQSVTQVKTWAEAKAALAQGYGIAVCSNQGFSKQRDAKGVCRPQGSWAHCMALDAYHIDTDGKEYGHIENSWGPTSATGPVGWGDPPTSGFWADSAVVSRMLGANDSWAFSLVKGFPKAKIDWFVRLAPQRLPDRLQPRPVFTSLRLEARNHYVALRH